jgi:hypothetical protein
MKSSLKVSEPSTFSIESLVASLAETFRKANYKVGFILSNDKTKINAMIRQPNVRFQLSAAINKLLGIGANYYFQNERSLLLLPCYLVI